MIAIMGESKFDFEFVKFIHFHELDRREKINSRLSIPVTIFLALIAGIFILFDNALKMNGFFAGASFWCLAGSTLLLSVAAFYFYRAMIDYTYGAINYLDEIALYQVKLGSYASKYYPDNTKPKAAELMNEFLRKQLIIHATRNAKNNDLKSELLHRTHVFLAWAVVPVALATILYTLDKIP